MILILFRVGGDTFGLEASRVIEVIPLLAVREVPRAPEFVSGLINFRGMITPVIDLSMLHRGTPSRSALSTRIIVCGHDDGTGDSRIVGLVAERATDTLSCRREDFQSPGVRTDGVRYLGDILLTGGRTVQLVTPETMLTPEVLEILDSAAREGA